MIKRPYMTFLSFAIAVIAAFWLGFSVFSINVHGNRPAAVVAVTTPHAPGHPTGPPGPSTPVTTHVS
jgi:hypothetical protein